MYGGLNQTVILAWQKEEGGPGGGVRKSLNLRAVAYEG